LENPFYVYKSLPAALRHETVTVMVTVAARSIAAPLFKKSEAATQHHSGRRIGY